VHGVAGSVYNLISDSSLQYNSRFVFIEAGVCPVVDGLTLRGECFSHPGSYLGELGLKTTAGERIRVVAGAAAEGFAAVEVNGEALRVGDSVLLAGKAGSVSLNNTHSAEVRVGRWSLALTNSDMYINQRVRVAELASVRAHGMLGQTWRTATYPNSIKYIEGTVDDYTVRSGDIFGDEFVFNMYN
jgi:hypothetical protein